MRNPASNLSRPRIIFLGSDLNPISVKCLEALAVRQEYEILVGLDGGLARSPIYRMKQSWTRHGTSGVLRRVWLRHKASSRLKRLSDRSDGVFLSLRELIAVYHLEGFDAAPVNSAESIARIKYFRPDLIVVANFSQIIRSALLSIPARGVINFHPSLLPKYRGPTPFYWILQNREAQSGVTVHFIDEGVDTGDIILQAELEVKPCDCEASLRERSIEIGAPLLAKAIETLFDGSAQRMPQNESEMSYFGFPPRGASRL